MSKLWLSYLLVALISCQSVFSFGDNHEAHDVALDTQIENLANALDTQDKNQPIEVDNCDHCGFCHNGQIIPLIASFTTTTNTDSHNIQPNELVPADPLFFLYRPPKA